MPIPRYRPGEQPPRAGKYELVDHFGEALNVEVKCSGDERLPLVAVPGYNSVWFVQADPPTSLANAA